MIVLSGSELFFECDVYLYACTAVAGGMILTGDTLVLEVEPVPLPHCPPQNPQASYRNRINVSTVRCRPRHGQQYCCHREFHTLTSKQSVRSALMKLRDTTKLTCFRQARYARIMTRNTRYVL